MNVNSMIIVGDKFEAFSSNNNILTFSEARFLLKKKVINDQYISFKLGQGLSEAQINELVESAHNSGLRNILEFDTCVKSGKDYVHKYLPQNSMLGLPKRLDESHFVVDVLIDETCDEMNDHLTGQHIQGMVITEAARQAFLAVTEAFYLQDNDFSSYFVINSLSSTYLSFVFPVPISIQYAINQHEPKSHGAHFFDVTMKAIQNEQVCAEVAVTFTTYNSDFLLKKEVSMAEQVIEDVLTTKIEEEDVAA